MFFQDHNSSRWSVSDLEVFTVSETLFSSFVVVFQAGFLKRSFGLEPPCLLDLSSKISKDVNGVVDYVALCKGKLGKNTSHLFDENPKTKESQKIKDTAVWVLEGYSKIEGVGRTLMIANQHGRWLGCTGVVLHLYFFRKVIIFENGHHVFDERSERPLASNLSDIPNEFFFVVKCKMNVDRLLKMMYDEGSIYNQLGNCEVALRMMKDYHSRLGGYIQAGCCGNSATWNALNKNKDNCVIANEHLSSYFYNAGKTKDLRDVVNYLVGSYPMAPKFLVGTSIGANIVGKYLGENGDKCPVAVAAVICGPWDLLSCSLREFDTSATCAVDEIGTADTYYRWSSCASYVKDVSVPLLCISSMDDPVCTAEAIPWDECRANKNVFFATTKHGGHLGYFEGVTASSLWWVRTVNEFFRVLHSSPLIHKQKELSAKIKQDLEADLEAEVNIKVKENMSCMLKKLGEANPGLNFDITYFCATASSDQDDNGTPFNQGGSSI